MSLDVCIVTTTLYRADGTPKSGVRVRVYKVIDPSGSVVIPQGAERDSAASNESGVIELPIVRGSTAYLSFPAIVNGNNFSEEKHPHGLAVGIPDAASANLEDLVVAQSVTLGGVTSGQLATETDERITADAALQSAIDNLDLSDYQLLSQKNQANGYVGLDESGLIPDNRIPASIARDSEVTGAVAAEAAIRAATDASISSAVVALADLVDTKAAISYVDGEIDALSLIYQPKDADLTAIAGLSPSANDVLQYKSGAWANRTPAQLKTDLAIASGDVSGLGSLATLSSITASQVSDFSTAADARITAAVGVSVQAHLGYTPLNAAATTYALLAGRAGGQTLNGGTGSGENIAINSTTHPTKGHILLGAGGLVGVNVTPTSQLHVKAVNASTVAAIFDTAASPSADIAQFKANGTTKTYIDKDGNIRFTTDNQVNIGASGANRPSRIYVAELVSAVTGFFFTAKSNLQSPADGQVVFYNNASSGFDRLLLGGTSNLSPSLKRSAAGLQARLADDSAYTFFDASEIRISGTKVVGAQAPTIANADGTLADLTTKFNTLLSYIKAGGSNHALLAA